MERRSRAARDELGSIAGSFFYFSPLSPFLLCENDALFFLLFFRKSNITMLHPARSREAPSKRTAEKDEREREVFFGLMLFLRRA